MNTKNLVRQIARFYKNYESELLKEKIRDKNDYLKSPENALFFVLSYSFYQGRRDEISSIFEERAKTALESFLGNNNILLYSSPRITEKENLKTKYKGLYDLLIQNKVNKEGDRLMVISLVNFIQFINGKNILHFLIEKIRSKKIAEAYRNLDGIWSIGPKIASLILRDVVYIYELENYLSEEEYYFLQPIDTWVHNLSKRIELVNNDKIYRDEAKDITDKCFEFRVNPIHYNQGVWYVGSNSLKILLENIDKI
ncbi:hypothetical protein ES704_00923 [subsurface metagenome]|jgi:hypothetical protein